jgi:flagellar biosynthesis GTPase FlhF
MFELIGELPQPAQDMVVMGSDLHSDETSSLSFSLSTEQDMQFPLSPLEGSANLNESPGGTSMSTGLSEAGTLSTDQKTPKAKEAKKARWRRSETEKKEQIKQRNRVAASKCRRKKKATVDELKEMKSSLEARNNELHMEYQQLRQEIGRVKSDLIYHNECNDSYINRWVENEAKGYVEKLVRNNERQLMGIGSADGVVDAVHMSSLHETATRCRQLFHFKKITTLKAAHCGQDSPH